MAEYYDELLQLCGFDTDEINRERPRIKKVFQRLELCPQDMKPAIEWVSQNHDIELAGVRKILAIWLRELFDMVLARDEGKKIVYFGFPTMAGPGMTIASASDNVYCACPDAILCHTMGQIFNKLNPILEAGEQNGLPPGHGLCTLQTIRVGGMAKGIIPVPDMVLTSSYYCDMGSKTDELLHERFGHPAIYVDGSMDSRWGDFPDFLPERVTYWGGQIEKMIAETKRILDLDLTPELWDKASSSSKDIRAEVRKLSEFMKADPQPISLGAVELATLLITGSTGKAITYGADAVATLNREVQERIDKGIGVVEKGAPRVMVFLTSFSDPRIMRMTENAGLACPVMLMSAPLRIEPWQTTYTTPGETRVETQLKVGIFHSSYAVAKRWAEVVKDFNLDGSIWGYQYNCRPLAEPSHFLPQFVKETTGLPTLSLEMDYYDSRSYSAESLRTRVETFAEMLRARKASASV